MRHTLKKINEINALTDSVNQYRLAVMEARREEDTWFAEDSLKKSPAVARVP